MDQSLIKRASGYAKHKSEPKQIGQSDGNFPPTFSANIYRQQNSDLRSLDDGALSAHYVKHGKREGRVSSQIGTRKDFLRLFKDRRPALEIGSFDKCLLDQAMVKHFDVLDQDALKRRASELKREPTGVPFIDFVSPTGDLSVIDEEFELVISSHAIEHTPDLILHLQHVEKLLTETGVYALMIPDCRYCFDHYIPPSTVADIMQAHVEARNVHNLASIIEHRALTTHNEPARHWAGDHGAPIGNDPSRVLAAIAEWEASQGGYVDVHAWQFTPESFQDVITLLHAAGRIKLKTIRVYQPIYGSNEFLAILGLDHPPH